MTEDKEVKKRYKGRGKTEKPLCPICNNDMKRSYGYKEGTKIKVPYGWHCESCKQQIFDEKKE